MTCRTCPRWARHPGSRYGRCAVPREGPPPYWFGAITSHNQIDTADVHGANCKANLRNA